MLKPPPASMPPFGSGPEAEKAGCCLCLNAAEGLLQLVIARRESAGPSAFTLLCAEAWHAPSQGAELLAPALADALARLKLAPGDIDRIACVRGPGSFTGLRLVLATAAGLIRTTGAKQAGMDYLSLLAVSAARRLGPLWEAGEGGPEYTEGRRQEERVLWVLTHARKNLIHMQGFGISAAGREAAQAVPFTDIHVCSPLEAALFIQSRRERNEKAGSGRPELPAKSLKGTGDEAGPVEVGLCPTPRKGAAAPLTHACETNSPFQGLSAVSAGSGRPFVLGSGLRRNYPAFAAGFSSGKGLLENGPAGEGVPENDPAGGGRVPLFLPPDFDQPLPEAMLELAGRLAYSRKDIEPLYVRPSDAEENLERIALSLGLDPAQARDKLASLTRSLVLTP